MTQFRMVSQEEASNQQFRYDLPVYAYIRFSTLGQVKDSKQSKKQQDTRMHEKLVNMGFTNIVKKDKDEGISAQKGTDERADLADIYKAMEKGQCAGIAAWDASRLWRDRDRVYYNEFIKKIKKYNVPVILHNKTYWPKIESDMELLRTEFEYSQKALSQFYDKANPARQEAVLGGSFGGHAVPMGFVVIGEKGSKKYAVYEPHRKLVEWLFQRYRALNGNLGRLHHELVACDFHFPDFDQDILRQMGASTPHVALTHDSKGYRLQSRNGLISILTNRAYLGWYCFNATSEESRMFTGEYINKEAHDPAIDCDLFQFAYSRLSKYNLDGSKNEDKPEVERHYAQVTALLEGLITSDGIPVYAMSNGNYVARKPMDGWKSTELVVSIEQMDGVLDEMVPAALQYAQCRDVELADKVAAIKAETEERAGSLEHDIAVIDQGIREWELAKRVSMAENDEPGVTEAVRALKRLRADRAKLEAQASQAASEASELAETSNLLEQAYRDWRGMRFENKRRLVKLIVERADIREVSPHWLKLTVDFSAPVGGTVIAYMFRTRGSKPEWSASENLMLRRYYPSAPRETVLEKLPTRTWHSIMMQARTLGLSRPHIPGFTDIPDSWTFADMQLVNKVGIRSASDETLPTWLEVIAPDSSLA